MINLNQKIIAISGVKNSGKTTLISKLIPLLSEKGLRIATIKHDGHDFDPDIKGTDSYMHREAGAFGTAVFSKEKWMIIKEEKGIDVETLIEMFTEVDLIILEGFKHSDYPKVELIRKSNSTSPVSKIETVICYISDMEKLNNNIPQFGFDEIEEISKFLYNYIKPCMI